MRKSKLAETKKLPKVPQLARDGAICNLNLGCVQFRTVLRTAETYSLPAPQEVSSKGGPPWGLLQQSRSPMTLQAHLSTSSFSLLNTNKSLWIKIKTYIFYNLQRLKERPDNSFEKTKILLSLSLLPPAITMVWPNVKDHHKYHQVL